MLDSHKTLAILYFKLNGNSFGVVIFYLYICNVINLKIETMYILGNPILGKLFSRSSLVLNADGLFRGIRTPNRAKYLIPITSDPKEICDLLELDFELINDMDEEDVYDMIIESPYFTHECFEQGRGDSKSIIAFKTYYEDTIHKTCGELKVIRTEVLSKRFNIDFRSKIDSVKEILSQPRITLNMGKIFPHLGGYDKRNTPKDITSFRNQFGDFYEFEKYLRSHTYEEVAIDYLKVC